MKTPIFNIIFIPDTVDYQSIALVSLLLNSNFSFRLVGNALKDKEANLLKSIANCSDKLEYINFNSDFIIPHGTLLDILFQLEDLGQFCFCDSDLFLFNSLKRSVSELIQNNHIFSSAGRIENDNNATYSGFKGGATTICPSGKIVLATTFFCIYARKQLDEIISKYKVGFEQYRQEVQVPDEAQSILKGLNIDFTMFDTGKLLSVLYHHHGCSNVHQDLKGLVHIGGMSGRYLQNINLSSVQVFDESSLEKQNPAQNGEFNSRSTYEISLKKLYGRYFYVYLHYLIGKSNKPQLNISNPLIIKTINSLETQIENVFIQADKILELNLIINLIKEY